MSKKPIAGRFLSLIIWLGSTAVHAQTLTAEDAARLALQRPENAALLSSDLGVARGNLMTARTLPNPNFDFSREAADGFTGDGTENIFWLEQDIDISGRRALSSRAAGARVTAAEFRFVVEGAAVRAEAKRRFYDALAANARLRVTQTYAEQVSGFEMAIATRAQRGDASMLDLGRVRQETALTPTLIAEARADLYAARQALGALIGAEQMPAKAVLQGTLLPPLTAALDQLLARVAVGPRMAELAADVDAAHLESQAARRIMPDVTVRFGVRTIEGEAGGTGVLLGASVPLPLFDRNQGAYVRWSAEADRARSRHTLAEDRIRADVAALAFRSDTLVKAAADYQQTAVAPAAELRRLARLAYEAGEIGILQVVDAFRAVRDAELKVIELQHDARTAFVTLEALLPETVP